MDCAPVTLWICCHGAWLLRHGTLIVYLKITGKNYSKSLLICCVIYIAVINFNVMTKYTKHSLRISPQLNLSSGFHIDFGGGCLQNWSSVNKPQGQKMSHRGRKCIVPCYDMYYSQSSIYAQLLDNKLRNNDMENRPWHTSVSYHVYNNLHKFIPRNKNKNKHTDKTHKTQHNTTHK